MQTARENCYVDSQRKDTKCPLGNKGCDHAMMIYGMLFIVGRAAVHALGNLLLHPPALGRCAPQPAADKNLEVVVPTPDREGYNKKPSE